MDPVLNELCSLLGISPTGEVVAVLVKLITHLEEATKITQYLVGANVHLIADAGKDDPAHVAVGNLVTRNWPFLHPWLGINGLVADGGRSYRIEARRYAAGSNQATIDGVVIPAGMIIHLAKVTPTLDSDLGASLTISYLFNATDSTPAITLQAQVDVGLITSIQPLVGAEASN